VVFSKGVHIAIQCTRVERYLHLNHILLNAHLINLFLMESNNKKETNVAIVVKHTDNKNTNDSIKDKKYCEDDGDVVASFVGETKKQSAVTTNFFCPDIEAFLMDGNIQTKVEMLTSVHDFLDLQSLLMFVERLIKGGKFSGLGDSKSDLVASNISVVGYF
jgi:hypothetical protein